MEKEIFKYNLNDGDKVSKVSKALTSPARLEILRLLLRNSMTMSELSQKLYISMSSIHMHTTILKEAGLISITPKPGMHGAKKLCGIKAGRILIDLVETKNETASIITKVQEIPIGAYAHAQGSRPCGLVSREGYLQQEDESYCFYDPRRINAQLIWFMSGFLTYEISNQYMKSNRLKRVEISFEACAEAPGYNNVWPSDIFMNINGKMIATFRVKGDYGGTRGVNNPVWWKDANTQFGELITLSITKDCVFMNNKLVSHESFNSLKLAEGFYFSFTVGVDSESEFPGGINLFGRDFGNYSQDIRIRSIYE